MRTDISARHLLCFGSFHVLIANWNWRRWACSESWSTSSSCTLSRRFGTCGRCWSCFCATLERRSWREKCSAGITSLLCGASKVNTSVGCVVRVTAELGACSVVSKCQRLSGSAWAKLDRKCWRWSRSSKAQSCPHTRPTSSVTRMTWPSPLDSAVSLAGSSGRWYEGSAVAAFRLTRALRVLWRGGRHRWQFSSDSSSRKALTILRSVQQSHPVFSPPRSSMLPRDEQLGEGVGTARAAGVEVERGLPLHAMAKVLELRLRNTAWENAKREDMLLFASPQSPILVVGFQWSTPTSGSCCLFAIPYGTWSRALSPPHVQRFQLRTRLIPEIRFRGLQVGIGRTSTRGSRPCVSCLEGVLSVPWAESSWKRRCQGDSLACHGPPRFVGAVGHQKPPNTQAVEHFVLPAGGVHFATWTQMPATMVWYTAVMQHGVAPRTVKSLVSRANDVSRVLRRCCFHWGLEGAWPQEAHCELMCESALFSFSDALLMTTESHFSENNVPFGEKCASHCRGVVFQIRNV